MLLPPGLCVIVDTREKLPYSLQMNSGLVLPQKVATLKTADYSLQGYEDRVAYERKSFPDLLGSIGKHRERFSAEIQRLETMTYRGILVEGTWSQLENCHKVSRLHPNAAVGSILSFCSRGIPVLMVGDRGRGNEYLCRLLLHAYKHLLAQGCESTETHPIAS